MADHAVQICKEHDHKLNGVIVYHHLKNIPNRSPDEESKSKNIKIGENLNGQLNKQPTTKLNGHNPTNKQLNGQATKEQQLNGKSQVANASQAGKEKLTTEQDKQTNGQVKTQLKNGQLNGQQVNNGVNNVVNNGVNNNQPLNNVKSTDVVLMEEVIENNNKEEPMDTSEPAASQAQDVNNNNLLDETFEIETDQNNNIVMIKCKPVENGKVSKEINNNSVQQCKLPANNQQTHLNKTEEKTTNENENQALNLKTEIKLNGTSSPSTTSLNSSSNQPTANATQINNSKQSAQITNPLNNNNSKKINEIKLKKIAHAAMKRKVDEQTASITIANGLKNEKKILKLSNNGNETPENQQANQAKLNTKQLIDQLTKARNEELSTSPNENDQTPQLQQTKKLLNNNCNNNSSNNSKIKIPWDPKIGKLLS